MSAFPAWFQDGKEGSRRSTPSCGSPAAALLSTGSGSAAAAKTVDGTVGPGFTIALTVRGKNVTKLKAGAPYRFVIVDRADIHDFHLTGPGFDRVLTGVEFTGAKTFVLRLEKGSCRTTNGVVEALASRGGTDRVDVQILAEDDNALARSFVLAVCC